ncbi:MAG TPA: M23 family metallopeptidase [Polyangia bacterium]|nr:M23 family metallopeptidase [Polyangia bacterium]
MRLPRVALVAALGPALLAPARGAEERRLPAAARADDDAPPQVTRLSLPFSGVWGVVQGAGVGTHTGYATYALDFVPAVRRGGRLPRRGSPLTRFPCFGAPVLAPADGAVVRVADGARDWPAYSRGGGEGNYVIIEHAPREYSELRHLRARSVRVAVGQRVRRGDVVGACGNSGNAGTPHLHVAFLSSIDPIATRPVVFEGYEVRDADAGSWRAPAAPLRAGDIVRPLR